jgi:hypothetical protein
VERHAGDSTVYGMYINIGFPVEMVDPQHRWFTMENPLKMDDTIFQCTWNILKNNEMTQTYYYIYVYIYMCVGGERYHVKELGYVSKQVPVQ